VRLVMAKTSDNPFLDGGFIERVYQEYAGLLARQELGGEFITIEGAEWPPEYFPPSMWFTDWPEHLVAKVITLDPSKGRKDKPGDYSAFVLLGIDKAGVCWIDGDADNTRTTTQQVARAVDLCREFEPVALGIETNQFQELLAMDVRRVGPNLPVYGIKNFSTPKDVRIRSLTPYLARGDFRFRRTKGGELLVQQLQEFPEAKHDDLPDALEMAVRLLHWLLRGKQDAGSPQPMR
jgi:predicted phage terminase large subunit-like protein